MNTPQQITIKSGKRNTPPSSYPTIFRRCESLEQFLPFTLIPTIFIFFLIFSLTGCVDRSDACVHVYGKYGALHEADSEWDIDWQERVCTECGLIDKTYIR